MDNTIEYKGYTIKIAQDESPESPREWDNLGKMVCFHSRYNLGDKHTYTTPEEFLKAYPLTGGKNFILPLYLYDHSGITISTKPFGDRWDSGQVGFIYVSVENAKKEFPNRKEWKNLKAHVYKILEGEVKTYDQFLTGDIWGYDIEGSNESCWGFYGQEEAIAEAKSVVDSLVIEEARKKANRTKNYIQSHVPLNYRHA